MKYSIFTPLGVLAAIAGLASSVQAQPTVASNSNNGGFTLSGESLTTIESRTVQDDFRPFFLGNTPSVSLNSPADNNNVNPQAGNNNLAPQADNNNLTPQGYNNNLIPPEEGVVWAVTDDSILFPNEPPAFINNRVPFGGIEALDGNDRVQVRIDIDEDE